MILSLVLGTLTAGGCHQVVATAVYLWSGTDSPAEYGGLEGKRVVVYCRPPSSLEYRHAGASRDLARRVGGLLAAQVKDIEVVPPSDVENWTDENDAENFRELGEAVRADKVLWIDMTEFGLQKGPTLYQGTADVQLSVYDMENGQVLDWETSLGEIQFPSSSAVPAQEKSLAEFRKQFIEIVAQRIAAHFYPHDPRQQFAIDATAHR
jgi:hypothetical protein